MFPDGSPMSFFSSYSQGTFLSQKKTRSGPPRDRSTPARCMYTVLEQCTYTSHPPPPFSSCPHSSAFPCSSVARPLCVSHSKGSAWCCFIKDQSFSLCPLPLVALPHTERKPYRLDTFASTCACIMYTRHSLASTPTTRVEEKEKENLDNVKTEGKKRGPRAWRRLRICSAQDDDTCVLVTCSTR